MSSEPSASIEPNSTQRFARAGRLELAVPGFLPAVLYVPSGQAPRPVVVATHGAGGAPEYECEYWQELTRGQAFVLCLRGKRTTNAAPSGYYYPNHLELEREFRAATEALSRSFAGRLRREGGIYAGFSQGAIMGAAMIPAYAEQYPHLVLIEGGFEYWSARTARIFGENGGKRVLFVCGTKWCAEKSALPAEWLRKASVEVRIEYAEGAGHTPSGAVMTKTASALGWLLEGESSWSLDATAWATPG